MSARLCIHLPEQPAMLRLLPAGSEWVIGRASDNDLVLDHHSVSRRHARLAQDGAGRWSLQDLGSKNGIRVDGHRVESASLDRGGWFALGDVFCEFEPLDAGAVRHFEQRAEQQRSSSQAWIQRLTSHSDSERMLADIVAAIIELADCRRGFLLTGAQSNELRLRACVAMDPEDIASKGFSGSRSAVERALTVRRPVFLSDPRDEAWLRVQASVVARGIRALACLPLQHDGALVGVVYVDTDDAARAFTDLDAELLTAFAEQAATALAASDLNAHLSQLESWLSSDRRGTDPGHGSGPAALWSELAGADRTAGTAP